MDDAHTAQAASTAFGEEVAERGGGLVAGHAVQVEFGLHRVLPPAQAPQDALLDARAGVEQLFGKIRLRIVQRAGMQRLQGGCFICLALSGPWRGPRAIGGAAVGTDAPHLLHCLAEQAPLVVVDGIGICHDKSIGAYGSARQWGKCSIITAPLDAKITPMRILIANDDGFRSPGIAALHAELSQIADCTVVAPDRDRSGASNSLTLTRPLRAHRQENGFIAVEGTPTDCVHLAINGFLTEPPDMVVSGVNAGANMGDDVHYSGTVAAAMEGRFLGLTAIAVSLVGEEPLRHYATAARIARELIQSLEGRRQPASIVNLNVPDVPYEDLRGVQATRLGNRHKSEPVIVARDPRGRECYWIGPPGPEQDAGAGTDFHAVAAGYASVTPLGADMTRHEALGAMSEWVQAACATG